MLLLQGHTDSVRCVAYSPDGRLLASGSDDRTLRLWDIASAKEVFRSPDEEHSAGVEAVAFAPEGEILASATSAGTIHLWDLSQRRAELGPYTHSDGARAVVFTSDGKVLVSGGWDGAVKFCSASVHAVRRQVATFNSQAAITALANISGTRKIAAGSYDGKIYYWERVGSLPQRFEAHGAAVFTLAFTPDGRTLASADGQGTIKLWDFATRKERAELHGHRMAVYSLAFTPDGRTLLSGSADGTVRRWNAETGQERGAYEWHKRWVTSVAVAPNGMTAAAGSADHTIAVWDLEE